MIEIPEVVVLADQINESMAGKRIKGIKIPRSPGRFSFYLGDPNDYDTLMRDSYICGAGQSVEWLKSWLTTSGFYSQWSHSQAV